MAKRLFQVPNWTPSAAADAAALASASYMALKGGSTTQRIDFLEVYVNGMAAASAPTALCLARTITALGVTPTALAAPASDGPADPASAALAAPPVSYTAAATGPQRSNLTTDARLNLGINAFGGSFRWNAAPGQQWVMLGNSVGFGETLISSQNVGAPGAVNAHLEYEPY
jgi:hypothetical protein